MMGFVDSLFPNDAVAGSGDAEALAAGSVHAEVVHVEFAVTFDDVGIGHAAFVPTAARAGFQDDGFVQGDLNWLTGLIPVKDLVAKYEGRSVSGVWAGGFCLAWSNEFRRGMWPGQYARFFRQSRNSSFDIGGGTLRRRGSGRRLHPNRLGRERARAGLPSGSDLRDRRRRVEGG